METTKKVSRWGRGWEIARGSWRIFKAEKGLLAIEILSGIGMLAVLGLVGLIAYLAGVHELVFSSENSGLSAVVGIAAATLFYLIYGVVYSYFTGAFVHMVCTRLDGEDPTLKGSFGAANKRFKHLAAFGVVHGAVSVLVETMQERLPFAGKIIGFLGSIAWSVASIFAIPVIMMNEKPVGPINAVKESAGLIKKTWGEGAISQMSIMLAGFAVALLNMFFFGLAAGAAAVASLNGLAVGLLIAGAVALVFVGIVFSMLASIAQAALYYYAKTGNEPAEFNAELLRSAMTPQKAKKIFS